MAAAVGGPMAALRNIDLASLGNDEEEAWLERARLDAVVGGRLSMSSLRSGLKCYITFAVSVSLYGNMIMSASFVLDAACKEKKKYFPPAMNILLAWSALFRFANVHKLLGWAM